MQIQSLHVRLSISDEEMLRLYSGQARDVVARSESGQTVRFPAAALRPFVLHDGVHGRFRIDFDENSTLRSVVRAD